MSDVNNSTLNRSVLDNPEILSGAFWAELRIFLAVAKSKSFNQAAEMLNMSQPTVSRQVRRLQDLMGSQLLVATKHGVTLTTKGIELARSLSALDHSLFALTNELRSETRDAEGIVRLSVTDGLNILFVTPRVKDFSERFPKIRLHFRHPTHASSLRDNQTDLMISFNEVHGNDLTVQPLGRMHFIPIVARQYVDLHGLPTLERIHDFHFLGSEYYAINPQTWRSWHDVAKRGKTSHFCDNSFAYGMLVKAGLGIGLLGSYTVLEPSLVPLDLGINIPLPMYLIALTERMQSRPVKLVFEWLTDLLGSGNPWFADEFSLDHPPSNYDPDFLTLFSFGSRSSDVQRV